MFHHAHQSIPAQEIWSERLVRGVIRNQSVLNKILYDLTCDFAIPCFWRSQATNEAPGNQL